MRRLVSQTNPVSDEEIDDALKRLKENENEPQSRVAEIFLAVDNPQQDEEVRRLAERLTEQMKHGARFSAVAQQFSQSATAAVGGDLGWIRPEQLSPDLAKAVAKMRPGELSPPIRTGAGYYLMLVLDRRAGRSGTSAGAADAEDTALRIVQVVFPLPPQANEAARRAAIAEAQNTRAVAKNCEDMLRIGKEKAPQLSSEGTVRLSQIAPAMRSLVLGLGVGQPSQPIMQKNGVGVIMVCDKKATGAPTAPPSRDEVVESLMRQRLDTLARRYMRDLRRTAFVDVRGLSPMVLPLAVTMGEPAGIGGEIALAAWLGRGEGLPPFYLIDDPDRLARLAQKLGWAVPVRPIAKPAEAPGIFAEALPVVPIPMAVHARPGEPDPADAPAILGAIEIAVADVRSGRAAALVTNPIHKDSLYRAGFRHPGHTEYLAELAGISAAPVMMLVCPELRVVPVTIHLALRRAIEGLFAPAIVHAGHVAAAALRRDFGIRGAGPRRRRPQPARGRGRRPRPRGDRHHRTRNRRAARRRDRRARPAAARHDVSRRGARHSYDAALCMYHDQALIPIKTIDFHGGVNVTLGLPFVRTSPDHGTAFAIAGSGTARPDSLIAALRLAADMAAKRRAAG